MMNNKLHSILLIFLLFSFSFINCKNTINKFSAEAYFSKIAHKLSKDRSYNFDNLKQRKIFLEDNEHNGSPIIDNQVTLDHTLKVIEMNSQKISEQMNEKMPEALETVNKEKSNEKLKNIENLAHVISEMKTKTEEMKQTAEIERQQIEESKLNALDITLKVAQILNDAIPDPAEEVIKNSQLLDSPNKSLELAGGCVSSLLSIVPPTFCYKRNGDFGVIPTRCSEGYFRFGALCYEYCRPGYRFVGSVCWEDCAEGYSDIGAICSKWDWFNTSLYFKHSYISSSYTNFDSRANCEEGQYKGGALCYRDCAKIFLENCGIGACAASTSACILGVVETVVKVLMGVAQFIIFIASFGASSAGTGGFSTAKSSIQTAFDNITAKKEQIKSVINLISSFGFRLKVIEKTTEVFINTLSDRVIDEAEKINMTATCKMIAEETLDSLKDKDEVKLNIEAWDFTGLATIIKDCNKTLATENDRIQCAKSILEVIAKVDPTGLVGIAAGLMHSVCDV